jgi:hypothetical protein
MRKPAVRKSTTPAETERRLVLETSAPEGDERTIRELENSAALFRQFLQKAGDDPRYAEAVERSRERLEDIRVTIEFMRRGIEERRRHDQPR